MRTLTILAAIAGSVVFAGTAWAAPAPQGSYQQSCDDIYADWTTLTATCQTPNGGENYSTLRDYRSCEGDIANVRGRLQCVDDNTGEDDDDDDSWTPRGSYRASCRNEETRNGTLMAECRDTNGRWRYTELTNYRSCKGDIYNRNGILGCRRDDTDDGDDDDGDGGGGGYTLPGGTWRYSCRSERIYGTVLYAQCRDTFGTWRQTSLDLRQCHGGSVSNFGGRLVCQGGSGFGRITLYKHTNYGGKARSFTGSVRDLNPYAFGNQASSLTIEGGGMWELCDKPNYKGHCVIVSRNQPNLWVFGFNDRTESVRRVR